MPPTPPRSASRTGWSVSVAPSRSFGEESANEDFGLVDAFTGLDDTDTLASETAAGDAMVRRRLRVRTTSIPGGRIDVSALRQPQGDRASLGQAATLNGSTMRYANSSMLLARSNVLQVEVYGGQWNIPLPSASAVVQFVVVAVCITSQFILFDDSVYQLLMLAVCLGVQAVMLFFLHSVLHLRQQAAARCSSVDAHNPSYTGDPPRSRSQQWNPFFEGHADSFRTLGGSNWRGIWSEFMSLVTSGNLIEILSALVESKAFLLQRLLITVCWCALYVQFTKYLYRDEVCDRDSYETTFIHDLIGYEWRCKWLTDKVAESSCLSIIFTFSGAMFNEEAPAGVKGSEFDSFADYVYFFVVTLSTVGYGDFAPGVIPSRKTLGVDGKFVLVLAGGLSADELDTFIWELAHGHTLYCHHVVVYTTTPVKEFEEVVLDSLSKFGIRLCIKAGDTASGVSQELCKLRWNAVGAVFVLSDRRCGREDSQNATPPTAEKVAEDYRSVVRCLHARKFWNQMFALSCHLLTATASRQILDMGAEQVTSRHDLMLKIMAKNCCGCPGFTTLFCNLFKSLALPVGVPSHKVLSELPYEADIRANVPGKPLRSPLFPGFKEYLHGAFMCVYRINCPPFVVMAMQSYKYEELVLLMAEFSRVCVLGIDRMNSGGQMLLNPLGYEPRTTDGLIILTSSAKKAIEIQAWDRDRIRLFLPAFARRQQTGDNVTGGSGSRILRNSTLESDEARSRSPERHHSDTASLRKRAVGVLGMHPSGGNRNLVLETGRDGPIRFPIPGVPESVSEASEAETEGKTRRRSASAGAAVTRDMTERLSEMGLMDDHPGASRGTNKMRGLVRQNTVFTTGRRAMKAVRSIGSIFGSSPHSTSGSSSRRPSRPDGGISPSRAFRSSIVKQSRDGQSTGPFPSRASIDRSSGGGDRAGDSDPRRSFVMGATRLRLQPTAKVDESRIIFDDFLLAFPELSDSPEFRAGKSRDPWRNTSEASNPSVLPTKRPSFVVVVGWPSGLPSFLRILFNSKKGSNLRCVVLSPTPGGGATGEIYEFAGKVAWVVGSPTSREDLARAGVGAADVVVVLTSLSCSNNRHGTSKYSTPQDFISVLTTHEIRHVKDKVKSSGRCSSENLDASLDGTARRCSVASMFSEDGTEKVRVSRSIITCLHDVTSLPFVDKSTWWPSDGVKSNLFHLDSPEFAMGNVVSESILFPAICRSPVLSDILVDAEILASLMIDGGKDFYGDQPSREIQPCVELVEISETWINERLEAFFAKNNIPRETREQIIATSDPLRAAGATFGDLLKHLHQMRTPRVISESTSRRQGSAVSGRSKFSEVCQSRIIRVHIPTDVHNIKFG
ncbi:hypothetical protein FOL47_003281 [Perkinsus chesapeaki]|uniref:Calcium-activated potassium channel subunit alpha-1 n=1 Tax=Perkinsus chesapeaki TaxID=330153 RepID=A0A7J6N2T3_PERCH|nr:hypothetical protein FOL47_003281 [Perkinsus chesapeaki]